MSLYFAFTLNNPTLEQEDTLKKWAALKCDHFLIGKEIAPTTGTPHFQGCFKLSKKMKLSTIINETKGFMNNVQCCKKVYKANVAYCSKTNKYWEFGKENAKPSQSEYDTAYELALKGNFDEISRKLIIKHGPVFEKIYMDNQEPEHLYLKNEFGNFFKNHFLWLQGKTGTGKSFFAKHFKNIINKFFEKYCKENDIDLIQYESFEKLLNKWFDNYKGEMILIIEEITPEWCQISGSRLKIWCDESPFPVEVKGSSFKSIRPMFIIITSNYSMEECFTQNGVRNDKDYLPLQRRCTELKINSTEDEINWPDYNQFALYLNTHLYVKHKIIQNYISKFDKILNSVNYKNGRDKIINIQNINKNTTNSYNSPNKKQKINKDVASTSNNIIILSVPGIYYDNVKCYCYKCYKPCNDLFCNECNKITYNKDSCNRCNNKFKKLTVQFCENCINYYKELHKLWISYQNTKQNYEFNQNKMKTHFNTLKDINKNIESTIYNNKKKQDLIEKKKRFESVSKVYIKRDADLINELNLKEQAYKDFKNINPIKDIIQSSPSPLPKIKQKGKQPELETPKTPNNTPNENSYLLCSQTQLFPTLSEVEKFTTDSFFEDFVSNDEKNNKNNNKCECILNPKPNIFLNILNNSQLQPQHSKGDIQTEEGTKFTSYKQLNYIYPYIKKVLTINNKIKYQLIKLNNPNLTAYSQETNKIIAEIEHLKLIKHQTINQKTLYLNEFVWRDDLFIPHDEIKPKKIFNKDGEIYWYENEYFNLFINTTNHPFVDSTDDNIEYMFYKENNQYMY